MIPSEILPSYHGGRIFCGSEDETIRHVFESIPLCGMVK